MDYKEFSSKIKAKYPQYSDMDDRDLATKMVAKFPKEYGDIVFDGQPAQPQQAQPQEKSIFGAEMDRLQTATEENKKYGQPLRAIANVGEMAHSIGNMTAGAILSSPYMPKPVKQAGTATLGAIGEGVKRYAEDPKNATMMENLRFVKGAYQSLPETTREAIGSTAKIGGAVLGGLGLKQELKPVTQEIGRAISATAKTPNVKKVITQSADMLKNNRGSIEIPDIDDFKSIDDIPQAENAISPKTLKDINKSIGEPPKAGIKNYQLEKDEMEFLSKPESPNETPMPEVMRQAQLAKQKRYEGVLTPLDKAAADKGGQALKIISQKKNEIGKIKGDLVTSADDYLISTGQFADATPIQNKFKQLVAERLGGQFNERGQLIDAAGRVINDSAEKGLVIKMMRTLDKLRPETTLKELDDVAMDLRNMVEHKKSSQTKQIYTKADGIGETIRGDIKNLIDSHLQNSVDWGGADQFLGVNGAEKLKKSLRDYANISKIEDRLNRGLGEVVDPTTGQAKMGASLLKSSLMSNSDRGTKALFRAVNELTGIDLMREAAKSEIAMKAVGDTRINDLLKEAGVARSLLQGDKAGAAAKLGEKIFQKWTGEKPDQILRYYYQQQKKQSKLGGIGQNIRKTLGNERGSIGASSNNVENNLIKQAKEAKNLDEFTNKSFENTMKDLYGFNSGDVIEIKPSDIKIKYKGDLENAQYANRPAKINSSTEPIDVGFDLKTGKFILEDGHHRYLAAKKQGVKLKANVNYIQGNTNVMSDVVKKTIGKTIPEIYKDVRGNTGLKMLAGTSAAGIGGVTTLGAIQGNNRRKK